MLDVSGNLMQLFINFKVLFKTHIMRTTFLILILFNCLFFLDACKKDQGNHDLPKSLVGNWEVTKIVDGAGNMTNYNPGNGTTFKFDGNNFRNYNNGVFFEEGSYKIIKDTFHLTGQILDRLILNDRLDFERLFIKIENDQLTMTYDFDHTGASIYRKF